MAGMKHYFTRLNAPIWLPAIVLLRDFLAWQYIFSFEPGITEQAAYRGKLFMLPGSLVAGGFLPLGINLGIALAIGLLLCRAARAPIPNQQPTH
jgi:hypothetical protein